MQENKEPEKAEDQEKKPPDLEEPSVPEDISDQKLLNKEKNPPDLEEPSIPEDISDREFEQLEGEVLPPREKKRSGGGFLLFILLLLTGGIGYLYSADLIPKQIRKQIEPLLKTFEQKLTKLEQITPINSKKLLSEGENEKQDSPIQKEIKKPPASLEEHISGSQAEWKPEADKGIANYRVKVSGNTTQIEPESESLVKNSEIATQVPKAEIEVSKTKTQTHEAKIKKPQVETEKEETPWEPPNITPAPATSQVLTENPIEKTEVGKNNAERSEAVKAYLDFVESSLTKAAELIKEGFIKGKDFLLKSLT